MSDPGGYRVIRSIAVHAEDIVTALEANRRADARTVLRVTPPFSGRMRARIHVEEASEYEMDPEPIHIAPDRLVVDVPPYPMPDETEQRLRDDPGTDYSIDAHHERHVAAVREWRETVADSIVESVALEGKFGPHSVAVTALG